MTSRKDAMNPSTNTKPMQRQSVPPTLKTENTFFYFIWSSDGTVEGLLLPLKSWLWILRRFMWLTQECKVTMTRIARRVTGKSAPPYLSWQFIPSWLSLGLKSGARLFLTTLHVTPMERRKTKWLSSSGMFLDSLSKMITSYSSPPSL